MNDNFDLRKFLVENKSIENMNPIFRQLNENTENTQTSDSTNDRLFTNGIHFRSEYKMKGIPNPRIVIPYAIEGGKTVLFRYKDDKKKKDVAVPLDIFLEKYELHNKLNENTEDITINGKLVANAIQNGDRSYTVTFEDDTKKTFWVNQDEWDELNNKYGTGKPYRFPTNENALRAKIREMVLNELGGGEDYDLESRKQEYGINPEMDDEYTFDMDVEDEDELYEAKKDKEEDIPADDAELDPDMAMDAEIDAPEDELTAAASGATGDAKELINHLMMSLDTAKEIGNQKLTTQILNTLKFAIDQSMAQ